MEDILASRLESMHLGVGAILHLPGKNFPNPRIVSANQQQWLKTSVSGLQIRMNGVC